MKVRSRTPAYRIVVNPRPGDYVSEMRSSGYASAYQPAAPTRTVLSRPVDDPVRRASWRVPEVPPGVYLVLIYDGSEGGSHSTWDYFHVLGPAPARERAPRPVAAASPDPDGWPPALVALGVACGVVAGAGAVALVRRRRSA